MCSFEVSIGMLPLILTVSSKESLLYKVMWKFCQEAAEVYNKTCEVLKLA